jgi:hypothetical protein
MRTRGWSGARARVIAAVQAGALSVASFAAASTEAATLAIAATPAGAETPEGFAGARKAGDAHAAAGDDTAALAAWRTAYGRAPSGAEGDEAREALMLDIGRAERRLYASGQDPAHLRRAEAALQEHLAASLRRAGEGDEAVTHRAEVEGELAQIREQLAALDGPATPAPVPPPVVIAPAPPLPTPTPPPADPVLMDQRRTANALVVAGAVFTSLGGSGLVLLAVPAALAGGIAQDRADNDPIFVSESELRDRADRRFYFAKISALAGLGSAALGGILLGVGLSRRVRIDREIRVQQTQPQASVSPFFSARSAGGSLTVRF